MKCPRLERSYQQGSEFKNGKKKYLGTFTKARDAAMAYDDANVKNDRPEKYLNFPAGMPIEDQEPGEVWC